MRTDSLKWTKKWLWLLLIPLVILNIPLLLVAMMIGSRLLSIVAAVNI